MSSKAREKRRRDLAGRGVLVDASGKAILSPRPDVADPTLPAPVKVPDEHHATVVSLLHLLSAQRQKLADLQQQFAEQSFLLDQLAAHTKARVKVICGGDFALDADQTVRWSYDTDEHAFMPERIPPAPPAPPDPVLAAAAEPAPDAAAVAEAEAEPSHANDDDSDDRPAEAAAQQQQDSPAAY